MSPSSWKSEVRSLLDLLEPEFRVDDAYRFVPLLQRKFPANQHIPEQIRKQLQALRNDGVLESLRRGVYRQKESTPATPWPFTRRQICTREEIAEVLAVDANALRRGMFKPAKGPSRHRMVLFSDVHQKNPYGDHKMPDGSFVYTGQRGQNEGKLEHFNKTLAEHTNNGVEVHLFIQKGAGELEYEGEVVVKEYQQVLRADRRRYWEFELVPMKRDKLGTIVGEVYNENLEFHLANRTRLETIANRTLRNRAFRDILLPVYGYECVVCGPPLANGTYQDLQGAHILAVCDDGPDAPNNGIALCARHHWAFDHGIFALGDNLQVVLPDHFDDPHGELRHGRSIKKPSIEAWTPLDRYVALHRSKWGL